MHEKSCQGLDGYLMSVFLVYQCACFNAKIELMMSWGVGLLLQSNPFIAAVLGRAAPRTGGLFGGMFWSVCAARSLMVLGACCWWWRSEGKKKIIYIHPHFVSFCVSMCVYPQSSTPPVCSLTHSRSLVLAWTPSKTATPPLYSITHPGF